MAVALNAGTMRNNETVCKQSRVRSHRGAGAGAGGAAVAEGRLDFGTLAPALARVLAPFESDALHVLAAHPVLGGALLRELAATGGLMALPTAVDAQSAAAGKVPLPLPLVNQITCCLYGAGYTDDMNQAKPSSGRNPQCCRRLTPCERAAMPRHCRSAPRAPPHLC
jgi:hypothetical protein